VLDVNLPDLNGLDLQKLLVLERPAMPIIIITGYGDVPMTVRAMKAGAVEFLMKPFADDVLLDAIGQAIERSRAALAVCRVCGLVWPALTRVDISGLELGPLFGINELVTGWGYSFGYGQLHPL
jgi:DNA-binding response OmpR family regulator